MQSRGLFLCCRLPWLLRFMDNFGSASHKNLFLVSLWRVHLSLHWKSNKGIWTTLRIWIKCAIFSSPLNLQDSRGIQCVLKTWTLILIIHHYGDYVTSILLLQSFMSFGSGTRISSKYFGAHGTQCACQTSPSLDGPSFWALTSGSR